MILTSFSLPHSYFRPHSHFISGSYTSIYFFPFSHFFLSLRFLLFLYSVLLPLPRCFYYSLFRSSFILFDESLSPLFSHFLFSPFPFSFSRYSPFSYSFLPTFIFHFSHPFLSLPFSFFFVGPLSHTYFDIICTLPMVTSISFSSINL